MLSDPSIRVHAAGAKCDKDTDQLPRRTHQRQQAHAATTYEKAEWHQPDAWHEKRHDLRNMILKLFPEEENPEPMIDDQPSTRAQEHWRHEINKRKRLQKLIVHDVQADAVNRREEREPVEDEQQDVDADHTLNAVGQDFLGEPRVLLRQFCHVVQSTCHANGEKKENEIARDIDERTEKHRYLPKTCLLVVKAVAARAVMQQSR